MAGLADRVALVTGGASGIGRAACELFARDGARVVVADVDARGGEETAERVRAAGADALFVRADVSDAREVDVLVAAALARFGRLDCAFNNAGFGAEPHPVAEMPEALFDRAIAVMLRGVFLCMKAELAPMLRAGRGAIVNCASGAGLIGFPGQCGYVAAKHGVLGLTKSAALEVAARGVRVNAICPGSAHSGIVDAWLGGDAAREAQVAALHPIGRIADAHEIAEAAVWLCSERASFVVGAALSVDGGFVAQ